MSKAQGVPLSKLLIGTLALLFIPLLTGLGLWQLERAEEKRQLLNQWNSVPEVLNELPRPEGANGLRVSLSGRFNTDVIYLLDNRTRNGRSGYEVIMPFIPEGSSVTALVNLGWIAASSYREELPQIAFPIEVRRVTGRVVTPKRVMQLSPDYWGLDEAVRIQQLDMLRLAERHPGLYPAVIRSDTALLPELTVGWQVVNITPDRHLGYAVQWFGLAIVLLSGCVWLALHQDKGGTYG
ncbi:SURF1 family protein [Amphritea japonica]|uniref:SURF1-like protein n=1 Tax=Amphritea japonica ATCC BAA-1530 TaxID=1278309 RepID=A0A7R6SUF9_9GAMM|nr:SURF1 family protein [Amphritea japonica]BBB27632.1 surfeit locus 1 family protein [Amphritea japonica ATCC BAA-1530]